MILPLLGLVAAVGVAAFFAWERHDMAKTYIEAELNRRHASLVRIQGDWADFDRDTLTYDVVYDDARGQRKRNRCKVSVRPGSDGNVYWSSPFI